MSRKKTQAYTEEFRREAIRRSDQPGNTAASVARCACAVPFVRILKVYPLNPARSEEKWLSNFVNSCRS